MTEDRGPVTAFVAGAIGEPGTRTFLLQLTGPEGTDSYVLEKDQVAVLAEQALELLQRAGLSGAGTSVAVPELVAPERARFRVGEMQLGISEDSETITLVLASVGDDEPVEYTMTPAILEAAAIAGRRSVAAGRPLCPRCGLAMDADGHHCPKDNGDLREHRP